MADDLLFEILGALTNADGTKVRPKGVSRDSFPVDSSGRIDMDEHARQRALQWAYAMRTESDFDLDGIRRSDEHFSTGFNPPSVDADNAFEIISFGPDGRPIYEPMFGDSNLRRTNVLLFGKQTPEEQGDWLKHGSEKLLKKQQMTENEWGSKVGPGENLWREFMAQYLADKTGT